MFHHVARSRDRRLLFHTWAEGVALYDRLVAVPGMVALCVMPDHLHLILAHDDPSGRVGAALSGHTRWLHHRGGGAGALFAPRPAPEALPDALHLRRTVRYVHLNPCRAGLARDPLEWPLSTHRERVGFAPPTAVGRDPEPARFHAYVSGDPTVAIAGTLLPEVTWGAPRWTDVVDGVGGVCRASAVDVRERRDLRRLAIRTAWALGWQDIPELAVHAGCDERTVRRSVAGLPGRGGVHRDATLQACLRAVGDPRFSALGPGDLRRHPAWGRYARSARE